MAAPNLLTSTTVTGKTAYATPSNTSANVLLANASGSGKVYKIDMLLATNVTASAANVTVSVNSAAAGSGTSYPVASGISVPAGAALIVTDKSTSYYLEEDRSIVVTSGTTSAITYVVSYEEIS